MSTDRAWQPPRWLANLWVIWGVIRAVAWLVTILFRFLSGRPMSGRRRTDATFTKRGVAVFDKQARVRPTHFRPEWQHAARRLAVTAFLLVQAYGLMFWPTTTRVLDVVALVAALGYAALRVARWWSQRAVRREVINPLVAALAPRLAVPPGTRPETWLTVPPGYRRDPARPVVIKLPQGFDREAQGAALESVTLDRLRIAEPVVSWHNYGEAPNVTLAARPAPPGEVTLADVMPAILAAKETDLVLGMGSGRKIVSVSYWLDSPHVALSAPSQSGKSTAIAGMLAQQMRWGSLALIFDFRAESHTWAFKLPNAVVLTDLDRIHAGLLAMWVEVQRRQQLVKEAARAGRPRPTFVRVWVALEELNLTLPALRQMWADYRAADPERAKRLPKVSPAIAVIANLSYAGRSVGFHGIFVAQRLTAAATGDNTGAVRESLGIRYMIKPKVSTWKMLADGAALPKFGRKEKGRAHVVVDGNSEEVQGTLITEQELIALATSGTVTPMLPTFRAIDSGAITEDMLVLSGQPLSEAYPQVEPVRTADSGQPTLTATAEPAESPETAEIEAMVVEYLTLEEAVLKGVVAGPSKTVADSVETLKRYLRRDAAKSKPVPTVHVIDGARKYDRRELETWRPSTDPESQAG